MAIPSGVRPASRSAATQAVRSRPRTDAPATPGEREALARQLHAAKNRHYATLMDEGSLPLRPGVAALIEQAASAGLRQAIVTTTSRANVDALLRTHFGSRHQGLFSALICGEDVQRKKPDPEAYTRALQALGLPPLATVALEDSPGGVAAARAADVPVLVTRSLYFASTTLEGAIAIGPGLHQRNGWTPALQGEGAVQLADVERWHAAMDSVSQHG